MLRIKKVKVTKEKKINIEYEVMNKNSGWDEFSFSCSDEALPEFYCALKDLAWDVIEMCEQPDDYIDRIDIKSVSFSYAGEKEVMGAVISAAMSLMKSNCPLNLNTPHKASESYSDTPAPDEQLLSGLCVKRLNKLHKQCVLYIGGYRAQTDLFAQLQPALICNEIITEEIDEVFKKHGG